MKKHISFILFSGTFIMLAGISLLVYGISLWGAEFIVLSGISAAAAISDLKTRRIPDKWILYGILARVLFIFLYSFFAVHSGTYIANHFSTPTENHQTISTLLTERSQIDSAFLTERSQIDSAFLTELSHKASALLMMLNQAVSLLLISFLRAFLFTVPILLLVLLVDRILRKETMGGGDLKLIFMLSLYFDFSVSLPGLLYACILGIFTVLIYICKGTRRRGVPFGPSLVFGFFLELALSLLP